MHEPPSTAQRVQLVVVAGAGAGAGVGAGAGAVVVIVAYSQLLSAPGLGSPNISLLHAMEPVAVLVANFPLKP